MVIEEVTIEILEKFFKTQNMNIEDREPLLKLKTDKKNKLNIRIGNKALNQIIKNIRPNDITTLIELITATAKATAYSTAKSITERVV